VDLHQYSDEANQRNIPFFGSVVTDKKMVWFGFMVLNATLNNISAIS